MKQTFTVRIEWYSIISELPESEQLAIYQRLFLFQTGNEDDITLNTGFQRTVWSLIENKLTKPKIASKAKTWKTDYDLYKNDITEAFQQIISDHKYIQEQEKYYPNLDIKLTIEKAFKNFWATEAGWQHKKKSKSINLDWKSTFTNSLNQRYNQVYKTKEESDGKSGTRLHPALR